MLNAIGQVPRSPNKGYSTYWICKGILAVIERRIKENPPYRLQVAHLSHRQGVESAARTCYNVAMERDEAISRLQQHEADLRRLGVEHLYMFGSTARGEANHDSDVDLFFDYQKGKLGVYELMDVKEYAASILGRKTDIMTRDSLHRTLREAIEATAVRVF
jgi:predicted nucleotidyltransferase